jgi:DNA-binding MarR family transcriptional regulator
VSTDLHARAPEGVAQLPSWLVSQVALHARRLVVDALAESGVRRHHFTTLLALQEHGPSSQAELGRRLWIDRSDLHAVVGELEREGLVTRQRDARDRRRTVIALTPTGTTMLERLVADVGAAQDTLLEPLRAAERRELTDLLQRVNAHHARRRAEPVP